MKLIDNIREQLGFPPFEKIDPNTQELKEDHHDIRDAEQAGTCAVLISIYELSRTEDGFYYLLNKDKNIPWSVTLFGEDAMAIVEKIAQYGNTSEADVKNIIEAAGDVSWQVAAHQLEGNLNFRSFSNFFSGIRTELLQYLPAVLQLGKKLRDNSLDDRTHKMEGPVSGLMHKIEELFAEPQAEVK
jgi:hypothetical protein